MIMKRKCAVCGDTHQTNIIFKWQRFSDNTIFHICGMCAEEPGKVNADSVKIEVTKTYTTVDSEFSKNTSEGTLRQRATLTDYYRGQTNFASSPRGRKTK